MISLSISLISLALVYLILGLYKPQWALLAMKNPNRLLVIVITAFVLMMGVTLYGEGYKRKQQTITESPVEKIENAGVATATPTIAAPLITVPSPVLTITTRASASATD